MGHHVGLFAGTCVGAGEWDGRGGVEGGVVVLVGIVEFLKVAGEGWVVIGITRECTARVGWVGGGGSPATAGVCCFVCVHGYRRMCVGVCVSVDFKVVGGDGVAGD